MLNRIVLVGRLTADPEERATNGGEVLAKFRVAVNRPARRGEDSQADFFGVVCFRQTAEFVTRYLRKGNLVAVDGRCHVDDWTDRDGHKQRSVEVVADSVQNLTPRDDGDRREFDEPRRKERPARQRDEPQGFDDDSGDDPFGDE